MSQSLQPSPSFSDLQQHTSSYTFSEILQLLHEQEFTGSITIHFRGGSPAAVDFGRPLQVTLSSQET